jgi:sorbitol-specific phosphotransferase system component IIA
MVWPVMLLMTIILVHPLAGPDLNDVCYFHARANPSAGMVQYAQTTMCNLNNHCYNESVHQEIPTFPGSR